MPKIFKNPNLPDYFADGVPDRSYVAGYEAAQVIAFPGIVETDHSFWAGLDVDTNPALRKLRSSVNLDDPGDVQHLKDHLIKAGVGMAGEIADRVSELYRSVMPHYRTIFSDYARFLTTKAVFRLTPVYTENMHFDMYKEASPQHLARMFINLDDQPRIWHTSWRAIDTIGRHQLSGATPNDLWTANNLATFGKTSADCWDSEPRHIAFFDPGDAWIVDSRQVAHQIFYGRRALSIDFAVEPSTMLDPSRFYLNIAEKLASRDQSPESLPPEILTTAG